LPPTARFNVQTNELTVSLSNSSTDDRGISSYEWDFGDSNTSTVAAPTHTYAQEGSYTITLKVTDTAAQTNTTAQSVTVTQGTCNDASSSSYPAWTASKSYSFGDRVSHSGKNYEATWWSTGAAPSIYTNVWKVIDGSDNNCPDDNQAPTASFTASSVDLIASFTNNSSDDKGIVSHSWSFGDGSISSDVNPSHTYATEGSYSVSLTVLDAEGESATTSKVVTVTDGGVDQGCVGVAAWSSTTSYQPEDVVSFGGKSVVVPSGLMPVFFSIQFK